MKLLKRIGRALLLVLCAVVLLFALAWGGLFAARAVVYREYLSQKEVESRIPALAEGFVPQGLAVGEDGLFLHSGYHAKSGALQLFYCKGDAVKELIPTLDGVPMKGHGGGISIAGEFVYLADGGCVSVLSLAAMQKAADGAEVAVQKQIEVDTSASFCFSDGKSLYVGEYYRPGNYELDLTHAYTTPSGEQNRALVQRYALSESGEWLDSTPLCALSIPAEVQGIAVAEDGGVMLSCSWGLASSRLQIHEAPKDSGTTVTLSDNTMPLYYLDSTTHTKTITLPAFSEGLDIANGRVYVTFESACNKYIVGKLFFADKVVSLPIE